MAWAVILLAGLLEVGWAVGLKYSDGFTRPLPSIATSLCLAASIALLGLALRTLPLATAYAVWTGIGTLGTAIVGVVLLGESMDMARLACLAVIVGGIVGLKLLPMA